VTVTDVEFPPFILTKPSIKVGIDPDLKELRCAAHQVEHAADQDTNDYDTFCGSYRVYGVAHHTLTLSIYQNYDTDGPWQVLHPLAGQVVDFEFLPDATQPVSATNPLMKGKCRVPTVPFIAANVNEASDSDIELAIQGEPEFLIVPPTTTAASASSSTSTAPSSGTTPAA
jgi:hypothetical protein